MKHGPKRATPPMQGRKERKNGITAPIKDTFHRDPLAVMSRSFFASQL